VVLLCILAGDFRSAAAESGITSLMCSSCSSSSGGGGSLAVARDIFERDGLAGFYRGLGASMATSLPSGMVWWATYEAAKVQLTGISKGT
jgi:hypothetical protein